MSDPFYHPPASRQPPDDASYRRALARRHWLGVASGVAALLLIAAIWLIGRGH